MSLTETCMLVRVSIGQWGASTYDRKATKTVNETYRANGAGRFHKTLMKCESLTAFEKNAADARAFIYEFTSPWLDGGPRILSNLKFEDVNSGLQEYMTDAQQFADEFAAIYEGQLGKEEERLGDLYNPMDYPDASAIRGKFYFSVTYAPIPEAGDWRIKELKDHEEELRASTERQIKEAVANATQFAFDRVHYVIERVVERLGDPDKSFHKTLIGNVDKLVDVLPALNVANDPRLTKLTNEIQLKIAGIDSDGLRKDKEHRAKVTKDAKRILDKVEKFRQIAA